MSGCHAPFSCPCRISFAIVDHFSYFNALMTVGDDYDEGQRLRLRFPSTQAKGPASSGRPCEAGVHAFPRLSLDETVTPF